VPQFEVATPQPVPHELAPHGSQLVAQGAEQHELTLLPQKIPAFADDVMTTTAARDNNIRISLDLLHTRKNVLALE